MTGRPVFPVLPAAAFEDEPKRAAGQLNVIGIDEGATRDTAVVMEPLEGGGWRIIEIIERDKEPDQ